MAVINARSGLGGGGGTLIIATRSDNNQPAVFATFADLQTYAATTEGTADAARINVSTATAAREAFVVGTLTNDVFVGEYTSYIRVNDQWVLATGPLQGQPGQDGTDGIDGLNAISFADSAERDTFFTSNPTMLERGRPVLLGNDVINVRLQVWAGANQPSSYTPATDAVNWVLPSFEVGSGSLLLGPSTTIQNGINALIVQLASGKSALLTAVEYDQQGNAEIVAYVPNESENTLVVNNVSDQTLTDPFSITYNTFGDNITNDIRIIPATSGTLRVRYWLGSSASDDTLFFDELRDVTPAEVTAGSFIDFGVGNPYALPENTAIFVEFSGIQLKGGTVTDPTSQFNGQNIIAFESMVQGYDRVLIAKSSDVPTLRTAEQTARLLETITTDADKLDASAIKNLPTFTARTDSEIQAIVGAMFTNGEYSGITPAYDATNQVINLTVEGTPSHTSTELEYGKNTSAALPTNPLTADDTANQGQWSVEFPALAVGEYWVFRLPDGYSLTSIINPSFPGVDQQASWTQNGSDPRLWTVGPAVRVSNATTFEINASV